MTSITEKFLKEQGIDYEIIDGKVHVGGYLDLSSLTSIPDGFNPTVGGSLNLSSLEPVLRKKIKVKNDIARGLDRYRRAVWLAYLSRVFQSKQITDGGYMPPLNKEEENARN